MLLYVKHHSKHISSMAGHQSSWIAVKSKTISLGGRDDPVSDRVHLAVHTENSIPQLSAECNIVRLLIVFLECR